MDKIKFLGTAGSRFVVMKQLRMSGGLWITMNNTNVLIDPGPGSLVRCLSSRPKLNPLDLDAIILTHRHLDHSNDVNIMIEAMTNGGFKKHGVVFAPRDALEGDPVVLQYVRGFVDRIEMLSEKKSYQIGQLSFSIPVKHVHGVETYGLNIEGDRYSVSVVTDTQYFEGLEKYYKGEILLLNVVRFDDSRPEILHLSMNNAEKIITANQPKLAVITHLGMTVIRSKPWEFAEQLSKRTGVPVVVARDGMELHPEEYL